MVRLTAAETARSTDVNAGTVRLGNAPVVVNSNWTLMQGGNGTLEVSLAGTNVSTPQFSRWKFNNPVVLGDTLKATLGSGYQPAKNDVFPVPATTLPMARPI